MCKEIATPKGKACGENPAESEVGSFVLCRLVETVFIEGVSNTREIGGFLGLGGNTVRRGAIYRGAYLDDVTEQGKRFAREVLGIRTDLDLRNEGEGSADDALSPLGEGVKHILRPGCMYTGNKWGGLTHVGRVGIDIPEGARKLVEELLVFADSDNYPIYVHCVLGRDRTGTLIAALLALVGVSEDDIMLDYKLSFFSQKGCEEGTDIPKVIGYFEQVLEYIKGFGGDTLVENAERFLLQSGLSKEAIAAIRQNVLE